ncbi:hypothetical protein AA313_de0201875 [Arthrobotrys entomopaga]|nr:hypothetical protein AA313_de0201875 [Arthrobotrys entomopaga]
MPSHSKVDLKSARVRKIRAAAAKVLSGVFETEVPGSDVSFIHSHSKGYHWYLSRNIIDTETGEVIEQEEFELPEWTTKQMHRWKIDESSEMMEWLRKGELQAEKIGTKRRKIEVTTIHGKSVEEQSPIRCFIQEVNKTLLLK